MSFTLARFLSCGIWFFAGMFKLTHFEHICEDMAKHGIPYQAAFLVLVIVLEIGGSILIFANVQVWLVALSWIGFMLIATPVYHGRFVVNGKIFFPEYVQFSKNISLAGGLIALATLDPALPGSLRALLN